MDGNAYEDTIKELEKTIERCKNYIRLIPIVDESVQSKYLHNLFIEITGIEELMKEVIR